MTTILAIRREILALLGAGEAWERLARECCVSMDELKRFVRLDLPADEVWTPGFEFNKKAYARLHSGVDKITRKVKLQKEQAPEMRNLLIHAQSLIGLGITTRSVLSKAMGMTIPQLQDLLSMPIGITFDERSMERLRKAIHDIDETAPKKTE